MLKRILVGALIVVALLAIISIPAVKTSAQQVGDQILLNMSFLKAGPSAQGAKVLSTGEMNTLSAAVASATLTEVVAAPAAGSIYLRAIFVEKSTTATGSVLVRYGTGTNCATGTTTLVSLTAASGQTFPFGYVQLGIQVPATKALCLGTDASTTSVRALTN
jgi:hypothetical protein